MNKLLKRGNHKLSSKIGIWTLPRSTCIGAGECAKWCYAKKMETMPNVYKSRLWRLAQTLCSDFVDRMVDEIQRHKFQVIRIHESGDFSTQDYVEKWFEIARQCPNVTFFAFTKAYGLLNLDVSPSNFIILQSFGSNHDNLIDYSKSTARVINDISELKMTEYLCPYHDKEHFVACGESCSYCIQKGRVLHVAFFKH